MKVKRYKKVHGILKFYANNFGFRKPYQVLLDGTICVAALKNQINIQDQFSTYLDGDVKLITTPCVIKEMEKLGSATFGGLLIAKKFGYHQCGHVKAPVPAFECLMSMIGDKNSSRYIIATQDLSLQRKCRKIEGVPLLYLHSKTPVLEAPSALTQGKVQEKTIDNFGMSEFDRQKLKRLNESVQVEEPVKKKRKKKGGPNPLSCKKKKKKVVDNVRPKDGKKSKKKKKNRVRNRSILVKKIKNEILGTLNS